MSSNLIVTKCLASWGTPEFASELQEEIALNGNRLPLDEHCRHGGTPSPLVELDELEFIDNGNGNLVGKLHISFQESYFNGCKGLEWSEDYAGMMHFKVSLETGKVEFTGNRIEQVSDDTDTEPEDAS